jgi:NAD+ kinase
VTTPSSELNRVGIVVHPTRDVSEPLGQLERWAEKAGVALVQVAVPGMTREVAPAGDAAGCELIVSIGGDGTMLAAMRAGMGSDRPVLGVACGSLGVLTRVPTGQVAEAMERFSAGDWYARELAALEVQRPGEPELLALNDLVVVRAGIGQIRVTAHVDGVLFGRIAGDGVIVSTGLGSSAYSLAAGGPLLGIDTDGLVLTPLPTHGGAVPPLVVGARSRIELVIGQGFGGARLEIDGQIVEGVPERLHVGLRTRVARIVAFPDREPLLTVLRRRGIIVDSPRVLAEDLRLGRTPGENASGPQADSPRS